jgi:Transglycosylase SLT domain.
MSKIRYFLFSLPVLAALTLIFLSSGTSSSADISMEADGYLQGDEAIKQDIRLPLLPDSISFAEEEAPLQYFDVREALHRELTSLCYLHGTMLYILRLDGRYGTTIKRVLREEGIPEDFYYLCVTESMLQPLVSPANAAGYWQFLAATGREYGLVVNAEIDERYHVEKSTRAAAAYLKKAYEEFGTWTLAAASYNTGIKNVKDRIQIQSLNDYYEMQFVEETSRYVFRILAHKLIMTNPADYGFIIRKDELFPELEYKEVTVSGSIDNWSVFAAEHNTNFKMLKMYNQWIRSNKLDNTQRKSYIVQVPAEGFRER